MVADKGGGGGSAPRGFTVEDAFAAAKDRHDDGEGSARMPIPPATPNLQLCYTPLEIFLSVEVMLTRVELPKPPPTAAAAAGTAPNAAA